ncbi:hypothetical protein Pmar_PMAR004234 [Perkinsus marinus ATCC 50983]|uniref:Uncharacterized protein n=1 Tax=Perkinsus marinus (strain ATCC 50983 / TXsc) TaxID=423536 RepID=C5LPP0_PERM5|nr:hypothetical protein Pmar_PMAR004234 [Perkinsus marinus ATCC 50983]EER01360.1 hypothetical protein Pmar_PMAR004234 [Perkinsus marinus ATCC 50983]|eukprot:XP_002768642.1 hypothetical protein Pmar_PMAR004234 [Perkinsus marinus ATCC 50983]
MSAKQLVISAASAAVMLSSLIPCNAVRAAVQSASAGELSDYPPTRYATFDERKNALHCGYDNRKKNRDDSAALDFYIVGNGVQTGAITCPKAGKYPAFRTSYLGSPTLKMYNPHIVGSGAYFSLAQPTTEVTYLDPLRNIQLSPPSPRAKDESPAKNRQRQCLNAIQTIKRGFGGSFRALCDKHHDVSVTAINTARADELNVTV